MTEHQMETKIQATNPTPARLTPDHIDSVITSTDFHTFPGSLLTICQLTLRNGFTVTGQSACADPANFNVNIGREIAETNARREIWQLEGYLLKERLSNAASGVPFPHALTHLSLLHAAWSQATFGPDDERGPIGPLKHLIKEAGEILDAPDDLEEYADALLLLLDASRRAGFSSDQLVQAGHAKLKKNKARTWPDAAAMDEPIEHLKTPDGLMSDFIMENIKFTTSQNFTTTAEIMTRYCMWRDTYKTKPAWGARTFCDALSKRMREVGRLITASENGAPGYEGITLKPFPSERNAA